MKHFYICMVVFLSILAGSLLSYRYTSRQISNLKSGIEKYTDIQQFSSRDIDKISEIRTDFFSNKNMLQFFIDKEHIHNIEINILLMENYARNNDADGCREKSIEAVSVLEQIKEYSIAID